MLNFFQKIPDFNPVAAGTRASVRLPNGPAYREIVLKYAPGGTPANEATMIADIEQVVIKVNGIARYEISGERLVKLMNKYYQKGTFNAGELPIPLSRPWARTMHGEDNLAWGTRNVDSLFLEVKIASGATSPQLSADAIIIPESRDLGLIVEVHEFQYDTSTIGKKEIADLPTGNGALAALHLENANITALEAKVNKLPFVEDDTDLDAYQNYLARAGGRTPQSGYVHIDALALNRIDDAWPLAGVQDFRVNPTLSVAGSIPIVMETLSQPLGPAGPVQS